MKTNRTNKYYYVNGDSDLLSDIQIPIIFGENAAGDNDLRVLSLFSGCGGMDLGFEGNFIVHKKSISENAEIEREINSEWALLKKTRFKTVFANDILPEAQLAWTTYMERFGYGPEIYHLDSIVDLVKMAQEGVEVFPKDIDIVTGGFPCQDFSVAGKRRGFDSIKDDRGKIRSEDQPSEESRGKLYYWMKQVIDIVRPKMFIAENVKGLVNLGDVKKIIQHDFASADDNGYIVLNPKVLHAGDYGVPESRERVIFIGIRRNALNEKALHALESEYVPKEYDPYPAITHSCSKKDSALKGIVTTGDVLAYLPEPHDSLDPSQSIYSKAKYLPNGSQGQIEIKMDGIGPTIRSEHHGNIEFRRLSKEHGGTHLDELAKGMVERRLTPRECALIQTFPPDYKFVMRNGYSGKYRLSPSGAYRIIGNAVPPVLAYNIAMRIQKLWPIYFE